jgi:hypothetical protein
MAEAIANMFYFDEREGSWMEVSDLLSKQICDMVGTFYRFTLPKVKKRKWAKRPREDKGG